MAKHTPEEFLTKTEHLFSAPNAQCEYLHEEFYRLYDEWEALPPGALKNRLAVTLRSLALRIKLLNARLISRSKPHFDRSTSL